MTAVCSVRSRPAVVGRTPRPTAAVGRLLPLVAVGLGAVVLGEPFGLRVAAATAVVRVGVGTTRRKEPVRRVPHTP
ncbi:hypothetical protein [Streptomyces sp. NPDC054887]